MGIQLPSLFGEKICKNDVEDILGLKDDPSEDFLARAWIKLSSQSDKFP